MLTPIKNILFKEILKRKRFLNKRYLNIKNTNTKKINVNNKNNLLPIKTQMTLDYMFHSNINLYEDLNAKTLKKKNYAINFINQFFKIKKNLQLTKTSNFLIKDNLKKNYLSLIKLKLNLFKKLKRKKLKKTTKKLADPFERIFLTKYLPTYLKEKNHSIIDYYFTKKNSVSLKVRAEKIKKKKKYFFKSYTINKKLKLLKIKNIIKKKISLINYDNLEDLFYKNLKFEKKKLFKKKFKFFINDKSSFLKAAIHTPDISEKLYFSSEDDDFDNIPPLEICGLINIRFTRRNIFMSWTKVTGHSLILLSCGQLEGVKQAARTYSIHIPTITELFKDKLILFFKKNNKSKNINGKFIYLYIQSSVGSLHFWSYKKIIEVFDEYKSDDRLNECINFNKIMFKRIIPHNGCRPAFKGRR